MKATFEFDMNDQDDIMAHLRCTKSTDMALILWNIIYNHKKEFEHFIEADKYETQYDLLDAVFQKISNELEYRSVNIDDLIS